MDLLGKQANLLCCQAAQISRFFFCLFLKLVGPPSLSTHTYLSLFPLFFSAFSCPLLLSRKWRTLVFNNNSWGIHTEHLGLSITCMFPVVSHQNQSISCWPYYFCSSVSNSGFSCFVILFLTYPKSYMPHKVCVGMGNPSIYFNVNPHSNPWKQRNTHSQYLVTLTSLGFLKFLKNYLLYLYV